MPMLRGSAPCDLLHGFHASWSKSDVAFNPNQPTSLLTIP
jgi:hypothetical protein